MKQILQNVAAVCFAAILPLGAINAQTTILEQDGANNEFVVADWTISGGGFANTNQVNVLASNDAILSISNTTAYTNLEVELHFSQSNTLSFDLDLNGPNNNLTIANNISDATGGINQKIVSFNNSNAVTLNEMRIYGSNMNAGITYLKITGTPDNTSAIVDETNEQFNVVVNENQLNIVAQTNGTIRIFNNIGQLQGEFNIVTGENDIPHTTQGVSFLVFTNASNNLISRKKILK